MGIFHGEGVAVRMYRQIPEEDAGKTEEKDNKNHKIANKEHNKEKHEGVERKEKGGEYQENNRQQKGRTILDLS